MALFDRAVDLDDREQAELLADIGQQDPSLADELAGLIERDTVDDDFLGREDTRGRLPFDGLLSPASHASLPAVGLVGAILADRYRLSESLGEGGAGEVYRACDLQGGPDVAVKILRRELMDHRDHVRRFRQEFRAIQRIDHPGCLSVFSEGEHDGRRFIVMEYVAGGNLERLAGGPQSILFDVVTQVAVALERVHRHGIVHRDLKPSNVLLAPGDPPVAKLADFGLAKLLDAEDSERTKTGAVLGTIDYLAPEQIRQQPVDPRCDLYALGCLIFRLWANRLPFAEGSAYERLHARLSTPAPSLKTIVPDAPDGLCDLVDRLLGHDPNDRPSRAAEVASALERASGDARRAIAASLDIQSGGFLYRPTFVGRDDEIAALVAHIDASAQSATGELMAIVGAGGLGKSSLVHRLRDVLAESERPAIIVRPESGSLTSWSLITRIERALSEVSGQAGDAMPELPLPEVMNADAVALARRALARRVVGRLRAFSSSSEPVMIVEDLHAAEPSALDLLAEIQKQLGDRVPRPVLMATLRPPAGRALDLVGSLRRFDLEPLPPAAVRQIAADMLAVSVSAVPLSPRAPCGRG